MIHAYDKIYLSKAQSNLAAMFDFAVYDLKESLEVFFRKFLNSTVSKRFESGESSIIAGKSGIEMALLVIDDESKRDLYKPALNRSEEYWTGWALAYFQWLTGLSFERINHFIPISEIVEMYNPYHEMDINQFCDRMLELYNERKPLSNLKMIRQSAGISQSTLSKITEIPLKTIQQYEQRQKNINAAKAETVLCLSRALNCSIEMLLEL